MRSKISFMLALGIAMSFTQSTREDRLESNAPDLAESIVAQYREHRRNLMIFQNNPAEVDRYAMEFVGYMQSYRYYETPGEYTETVFFITAAAFMRLMSSLNWERLDEVMTELYKPYALTIADVRRAHYPAFEQPDHVLAKIARLVEPRPS